MPKHQPCRLDYDHTLRTLTKAALIAVFTISAASAQAQLRPAASDEKSTSPRYGVTPEKANQPDADKKDKDKDKRGNTPPGKDRAGNAPAAGAIVDPAGVTK